ncbi:glycosyltransferase family 4 protein (plasmid) [Azospirillum oryzae]|uniref:Glycosyltransferase family 4 protein n=1 Tax=Azospirillum oryzae TaxID=286727 RepID=A0A6N1ACQ6_9PROT|nr:glycosyltransferase family 4 protein [Azospirillum oryzae]KAA0585786.1 glycosyltransferase family 4 protein [Azospirillum oryzae]QKS49471.1 glycosyltransferase family 4 protein [Azospirillum oryzae]GLR78812.1 glycosyl transferase [Azospirillum oryzae]
MSTIVILCDHAHPSGGLAKVAIAGAVGLARRGHRVHFFTAVPPIAPALLTDGITVHCLEQPDLKGNADRVQAALRGIWNREAARALESLLGSCPANDTVVHIHGWAKALSPSVFPVCRKSGLPVLLTLHDYFPLCPNGAFFVFPEGVNCPHRALSTGCLATDCDARARHHKWWRAARHAAGALAGGFTGGMALVTLSDRQRAVVARHLPPGTVTLPVPNPVEVPDELKARGPAPVAGNRPVLFVGRLSREKGAALLAEAAVQANCPVRFVGDGDEAAAVRRLNPDAELVGWLPPDAVLEEVRRARALVVPSLWYETFGLAAYEALANGVPIIVSDNCAAAEAVQPGENGFLFRSGDAADLARCLRLLSHDAEVERMGRNAHDGYWRAPFTLDRHLDRLEQVYRAALSDGIGSLGRLGRRSRDFGP